MPGDCYIAACGVASLDDCGYLSVVDGAKGPHEAEDNARRVMAFAKHMMAVSKQVGERSVQDAGDIFSRSRHGLALHRLQNDGLCYCLRSRCLTMGSQSRSGSGFTPDPA